MKTMLVIWWKHMDNTLHL